MQVHEACPLPALGLPWGPAQPAPYPDLDFWILQIDVPLGQQVGVGSWLDEEAPHLDEVRLRQVVTVILIEDWEGDAVLCRGEARAHLMTKTQPHLSSCISTGTERAKNALELTQREDGWADPRPFPCPPWLQGGQGK